jgi:hypothetical protein
MLLREATFPESTDCDRLLPLPSLFLVLGPPEDEDSALTDSPRKAARCCDRMDRLSSMGVNMLYCLRCGSFFTSCHSGSAFGSTGVGGCGSWICGG